LNKIHINQNKKFGLATKSPRRLELFNFLGLSFELIDNTESEPKPNLYESPLEYVIRASEFKTKHNNNKNKFIIASDTIVYIGKQIFGKPKNTNQAINMLSILNDKNHSVITAISLFNASTKSVRTNTKISNVKFKNWTKNQIKEYVNNHEVIDKAGSYAIQDNKYSPVDKFIGCKLNIIGLPICNLIDMLVSNKIIDGLNKSNDKICSIVESWQEREGSNP
jgi:MAF protein